MLNLTDIRVKFNTSGERQSLLLSLLMSRTPTRHEGSLFPEGAAGTRGRYRIPDAMSLLCLLLAILIQSLFENSADENFSRKCIFIAILSSVR